MAMTKEKQFDTDTTTLRTLRTLIPGDAPMTFKKTELAERINTTVPRLAGSLARLASKSLIDFETGRGTVTIIVSHNGAAVREIRQAPARKHPCTCMACGATGHNDEALYCWKCGKPLRTPEEILRDKFAAVLARFPSLYGGNTEQADRDMRVLREVADLAFTKKGA